MIKKLDLLLIRSYIGPFIVTFFVTLFVLVMQFFWLYMDELIGKGLGIWMILQLLFLMATTLVPLALPLAVLLASIMTFGNMGENFELVAIKASGISLLRFMQPLLIFIIGLSGLAFLFNNNIIPVANLKALSLLYDLRNSKPTLNIRAGQFNNDIEGFSIYVGAKDKDGKTIHDVKIYDQSTGMGNTSLVLAEKGEMIPSPDKQFLIFRLHDGWRYVEDEKSGNSHVQTRLHFGQWDKVFDLSGFKMNRTNEDLFKNAYQMLNVSQLNKQIDSQKRTIIRSAFMTNVYMMPYLSFLNPDTPGKLLKRKLAAVDTTHLRTYGNAGFISLVPDSMRGRIAQFTTNNVRNIQSMLNVTVVDHKNNIDILLKYDVEWHRKFALSFAVILLFLIGAPLGAIIRKGGLGMPMIIAVVFFLIWYIITITGEKLSKTGALPPYVGMWMSTAMLLPIAFVLIRQARNDSQIFSKEWYTRIWRAIVKIFPTRKKEKKIA